MVPPDSHRISRVPRYSGYWEASRSESCTGLSPSMINLSRSFHFTLSCHITVLQPQYCRNNIGLGFSRFARHYFGNHFCFLLLWVLRCFSSPRSPPQYSGWYNLLVSGCPIQKSADQFVFANPRSLSQLITSFIAFQSLGIPHVPLCTLFSISVPSPTGIY